MKKEGTNSGYDAAHNICAFVSICETLKDEEECNKLNAGKKSNKNRHEK